MDCFAVVGVLILSCGMGTLLLKVVTVSEILLIWIGPTCSPT
jgi:hypothetical protein